MKRLISLLVCLCVLCVLTLAACTGSKAEELFETAQFEERQNNREHAVQLYEQILKDYPESEPAGKAKERLSQIQKGR
jgi:TolA-binding protein